MHKILPTILGLLTVAALLTGCAKENVLKEPTKVGIQFVLDPSGAGGSDRLALHSGYVVLEAVEIEGKRQEGAAFTFKRSFPSGLRLDFNATNRVEELLFDLPQGEYEQLLVRFSTLGQTTSPCLMVLGEYAYSQPVNGSAWIDIAWSSQKSFERVVTTAQGSVAFTLGQEPKMIQFTIQPKLWFKDISEVKLEQGICVNQPRGQVMLINSITNDNMFQVINSELGTTLKATL